MRLMLADDHKLLRAGLRLLLQRKPEIEIVGEAADGEETLTMFEELRPDILLLDLSMPKLNGIDCLKEILSRHERARILVLTMHEDKHHIRLAMQAGAAGYIHKSAADAELFQALDAIRSGGLYLSAQDSQLLLQDFLQKEPGPTADSREPYRLLSPREREVLRLFVRGHSLAEIADRLCLSVKTVETYKVRIMEKLETSKKSELVDYALRYGLLQQDQQK